MNQQEVTFMCAHIFRYTAADPILDISFLEFPPVNPKKNHQIKDKTSMIFSPRQEKNDLDSSDLGVIRPNYPDDTYDWLFVLQGKNLNLFKAEGLRSFPTKSITINFHSKVQLTTAQDTPVLPYYMPVKILSSSIKDFDDVITLYFLNQSYQLIKFRRDLKAEKEHWTFKQVLTPRRD